jgi:hypothetical protein
MGNGNSIQIVRDPDPNTSPNRPDSVSISTSQQCSIPNSSEPCRLNIDQSISTSSVTLKRGTAPGEFSDDTKIQIIPSLPFRMYCNGAEVRVTSMTLYHPCPLRIENVQYDAVLSLNDPSDKEAQSILLIPIVGSSSSSPSATLLDRIGPRLPSLLAPNASKGFDPVEVATGADWALSTLLPTVGTRVQSGFYQWISGRGYESYPEASGRTISYKWRPKLPRQNYILIDTPIQASPATMGAILAFPRTEAFKALPIVSPIVTYTPCANTPAQVVESFANFDPECDPLGSNAYDASNGLKPKHVLQILSIVVGILMILVGVYGGLWLAGSPASVYVKQFGDTLGEFIYRQVAAFKAARDAVKGGILNAVVGKMGVPPTALGGLQSTLGGLQSSAKNLATTNPLAALARA